MAQSDYLQVSSANCKFAKNFYNILSDKGDKNNILFSPLSAHAILSLAYQGASGKTISDFEFALNVPGKEIAANGYSKILSKLKSTGPVALYVANKVFIMEDFPLKEKFQKISKERFLAETQSVNFGNSTKAAKDINQWVEGHTDSNIKDLIESNDLDALTRVVLVNAIYFKGDWLNPFEIENTTTEPFYLSSKKSFNCKMMHQTGEFMFREDDGLNAKVLELPYADKNFSMLAILPNDQDGIEKLEKKLMDVDLATIADNMYSREVDVAFPKFKIETSIDLKPVLEKMGLSVIFDMNKAEFDEFSDTDDRLYVSKAIQKVFLEVNEKGTTAAAATGIVECLNCLAIPKIFRADHPFVILLRLQDGTRTHILFYGKIVDIEI